MVFSHMPRWCHTCPFGNGDHTRWAPTNPTSYKWSYKPYKLTYKWVIWVITPMSGVTNLLITKRGPPCIFHPFLKDAKLWKSPWFAKAAQSMLGSSSAAAAAAAAAATAAGMEQEFWGWKWWKASNHQKFNQFSYIHRSGVFKLWIHVRLKRSFMDCMGLS